VVERRTRGPDEIDRHRLPAFDVAIAVEELLDAIGAHARGRPDHRRAREHRKA
jgi:hypothetical protein